MLHWDFEQSILYNNLDWSWSGQINYIQWEADTRAAKVVYDFMSKGATMQNLLFNK